MIIETFICPVSCISNPDEFNTFLLRNQKIMPLSSVGISSVEQEEYYIVLVHYRLTLPLMISCWR